MTRDSKWFTQIILGKHLIEDENKSFHLTAEGKFLQYQWVKIDAQMNGELLPELKIMGFKANRVSMKWKLFCTSLEMI